MENEVSGTKEVWISYIDDSGQTIQGFFKLIEQNASYVKIRSGSNILTLPYHKIDKIKERI